MRNLALVLLMLSFLVGCSDHNVNIRIKKTEMVAYSSPPKLKIFRKVDSLQKIIEDNSSMKFTSWIKAQPDNPNSIWRSHTPIIEFGGFSRNGFQNEILYHLVGSKKDHVNELSLIVNVKNSSELEEALHLLSIWSTETLQRLNMGIPGDLKKSISNGEQFYEENDLGYIMLKNEDKNPGKNRDYESWSFVIRSR